ncbi:MAG: hypothetical protein R6U96_18620 [Promethearchaeia archaeon]
MVESKSKRIEIDIERIIEKIQKISKAVKENREKIKEMQQQK